MVNGLPEPYYQAGGVTLYNGDSLDIMPRLGDTFDAVVADPPYSSGGMMRSDRNAPTSSKYHLAYTKNKNPVFDGDSRDQRSYVIWCELWLRMAYKLVRPGGVVATFTDWRQLAASVDAVQVAGWVYRGVVVWDKTRSTRPVRGWFRSQVEYAVLGTKGPRVVSDEQGFGDGVIVCPTERNRVHTTQKPVAMLSSLLSVDPSWSRILDPFCGSASTLIAAASLGRSAVGIEASEEYCEIAADRLRKGQ